MENNSDQPAFTVNELETIKGLCVKAMLFELAAKVREFERSHPDYKPKKKRGRPTLSKNKWKISTKNYRVESGIPSIDVIISPPKNATKKQKELLNQLNTKP